MAIRSRVFFMGYPLSAIKADIVEYEYSNSITSKVEHSQGF